jgi:predicted peptidase
MAKQLEQHYLSESGDLDYLLFIPRDYQEGSTTLWPLILFLHGRGESGDNLNIVKHHGIPRVIEEAEDFPCITVSPQCPANADWVTLIRPLMSLLGSIIEEFQVDRQRVYLTGLSMGGRGTWALAVEYPEIFAALIPICGRVPGVDQFMDKVKVLKDVPTGYFTARKTPQCRSRTRSRLLQHSGPFRAMSTIRFIQTPIMTPGRKLTVIRSFTAGC